MIIKIFRIGDNTVYFNKAIGDAIIEGPYGRHKMRGVRKPMGREYFKDEWTRKQWNREFERSE